MGWLVKRARKLASANAGAREALFVGASLPKCCIKLAGLLLGRVEVEFGWGVNRAHSITRGAAMLSGARTRVRGAGLREKTHDMQLVTMPINSGSESSGASSARPPMPPMPPASPPPPALPPPALILPPPPCRRRTSARFSFAKALPGSSARQRSKELSASSRFPSCCCAAPRRDHPFA